MGRAVAGGGQALMSTTELIASVVVTVGMSWGLTRSVRSADLPRVARSNYRGAKLNPLLGLAIGIPALGVLGWLLGFRAVSGEWGSPETAYAWTVLAATLVLVAGLADDLSHGQVRGLRGHLRAAARGEFTTGLMKVVACVGAGLMVVVGLGGRPVPVMAAGVILISGSCNVWNGLDVAPGRAMRPFLLMAIPLAFAGTGSAPQALLFLIFLASLPAARADFRERAMLGDCGSNLLGFAVGAAAYAALDDTWVLASAVAVVVLNLVAETVSFSVVIRRSALLRWFDRIGTTREWRRFSAERTRRRRML